MILHVVIGVFIWLLGLCVGSFLNVVVYRLPIGLSIRKPARSFCPSCKAGIAWYDNVPVLSWLLLRGRCRHCQTPISPQYPLVEAVTGFAFVLVYYLVFVARTRVVVGDPSLGSDIPLLAAWLVLVGVLMACAAMDVVSYLVDTRITDLAIGAGIVLHALWPRQAILAGRAESPLGAAALAAFVVSGLLLWRTVWRPDSASDARETDEGQSAAGANQAARSPQASQLSPWVGRLAIVVFVGLTLWLLAASGGARQSQGPPVAAGVGLLAMFVATVVAGGQRRVADEELAEALAEEGPLARRVALRELLWLSPAVAAAIGAYSLVAVVPTVGDAWGSAVRWPKDAGFAPLGGAVFAIYGAMIAATAGWVLRIVFTLLLGREAFGLGDIYILAAAGATAGWDIALAGLLLSVGLALAGWLLGLLLKSSMMIPFGPWLAIGFLAALWLNHPAVALAQRYWENIQAAWDYRPDLLMIGGGLILVGGGAGLFLARLIRRRIEARMS